MASTVCLTIGLAIPVITLIVVVLSWVGVIPPFKNKGDDGSYARYDMLTLAAAEFVGSAFILGPIAAQGHPFPENILSAIFALMKISTFGGSFDSIVASIHATMGTGTLSIVYACTYQVLAIATPLTLAAAMISVLYDRIPYLTTIIGTASSKKVYVFLGMDEKSRLLATDIVESKGSKDAFFCFTGCTKAEKDKSSLIVQELKGLTRNKVSFLSCPIQNAPIKPSKQGKVYYFLLSSQYSKNIEGTIAIQDKLASDFCRTLSLDEAKAAASRIQIVCLHANKEGELIIDSGGTFTGDESQREDWAAVRKEMTVTLFREKESLAWHLLREHPLYEVLDQSLISYDTDAVTQELKVVIVGLGDTGVELVKTCYWLGRMQSVALRIYAVDKKANAVKKEFAISAPEMIKDTQKDGTPTISFIESDIFDPGCRAQIMELLPDEHCYAFVTTGGDESTLNIGIEMRRVMDAVRIKRAKANASGQGDPAPVPNPRIALYIRSAEVSHAVEHLKSDRKEPYDFICFGGDNEIYSYANLVDSDIERQSIRTNGVYDTVWEFNNRVASGDYPHRIDALRAGVDYESAKAGYNKFEIKKLSNRAGVLYVPYRAWMLGLDAAQPITEQEWFTALGMTDVDTDLPEAFVDYGFDLDKDDKERFVEICSRRLEAYGKSYPILWAMARLEHDRWLAFYQSQGWQDISIEDMKALNVANGQLPLKEHQSPKMRRHCYMCGFDDLLSRGVEIGEDPTVYDLAMVAYGCHVLDGKYIFQGDSTDY